MLGIKLLSLTAGRRADQVACFIWHGTCCVEKELVPQVCWTKCHALVCVTAVAALQPLSEQAWPGFSIDSIAYSVEKMQQRCELNVNGTRA